MTDSKIQNCKFYPLENILDISDFDI